jgi:hypothetical protein
VGTKWRARERGGQGESEEAGAAGAGGCRRHAVRAAACRCSRATREVRLLFQGRRHIARPRSSEGTSRSRIWHSTRSRPRSRCRRSSGQAHGRIAKIRQFVVPARGLDRPTVSSRPPSRRRGGSRPYPRRERSRARCGRRSIRESTPSVGLGLESARDRGRQREQGDVEVDAPALWLQRRLSGNPLLQRQLRKSVGRALSRAGRRTARRRSRL